MSHPPATTPLATNPNPKNPLINSTLQTDLPTLRQTQSQTILPPLTDPSNLLRSLIDLTPPAPKTLPDLTPLLALHHKTPTTAEPTHPNRNPDPNNILVLLPTANAGKIALLRTHLTHLLTRSRTGTTTTSTSPQQQDSDGNGNSKLEITWQVVPVSSGVGEQPYDAAGPRGAFGRVVNAVRALVEIAQREREHRDGDGDGDGGRDGNEERVQRLRSGVREGGVGTVVVGAVENFVLRVHEHEHGGGKEGGTVVPVDYGVVVVCRISLLDGTWEWSVGVSEGVTVPAAYWREAEKHGFEDDEQTHGLVTVGEVLAANVPGLDKADWHLPLAGRSRYGLLREALEKMEVPWPDVKLEA